MASHATAANLQIICPSYDSFYKLIYSDEGTAPILACQRGVRDLFFLARGV